MAIAMMDTLAFRFKKSVFKNWDADKWYPGKSWKNKFKDGQERKGPKFIGSLDILSFFTEGYGFLRLSTLIMQALAVFVVCLGMIDNSQTTIQNLLIVYPIIFIEWILLYRLLYYKLFRD
jgi:hypothetical protein